MLISLSRTYSLALLLMTSSAVAVPKYYADFANDHGIDEDKLYAVLLAESGMNNEFGHYLPWPWSVTVNGRFYQFKTRQELYRYLKSYKDKPAVTYGIAGRPLIKQASPQLWDSLSVESNLAFAVQRLKQLDCHSLVNCVADYRQFGRNKTRLSIKPSNPAKQRSPSVSAPQNIAQIVATVSQQTGVEAALIHAIIARESAYKIKAKSHAGAMGLMQLMPGTARYLGLKPSQFYSPYDNVLAGARYIKEQLTNFDGNLDLALAAYNAGPGAVRKYGGIPPYKETQKYVPIVKSYYQYFKQELG